jgi:hypothetical protein
VCSHPFDLAVDFEQPLDRREPSPHAFFFKCLEALQSPSSSWEIETREGHTSLSPTSKGMLMTHPWRGGLSSSEVATRTVNVRGETGGEKA